MTIIITSTEGLKTHTDVTAISESFIDEGGPIPCYEIAFENPKKDDILFPKEKVLLIQVAND